MQAMTTPNASPFVRSRIYYNRKEQLDHIARETASGLPIRDAQICDMLAPDFRTHRVAIVFVDATKRPDVRDLFRVHRLDGSGDTRSAWQFAMVPQNPLAILNTHFENPARCHVRLVFPIRKHRAFLDFVAQVELLHLGLGTAPHIPQRNIETLGLEAECDSLRAALVLLDQADGVR
jgi:hypothetical protein